MNIRIVNAATIQRFFLGLVAGMFCIHPTWMERLSEAQESSTNNDALTKLEPPLTRLWLMPSATASRNSWDPSPLEVIEANVVEIDEQNIVMVSRDKSTPVKLPSIRLQAIEIVWGSVAAAAAHHAFEKREYADAIDRAKNAIADGKIPRWQQRILAAEITESLVQLGQTLNAGRIFISLAKESPPPMLYRVAPLLWTSQRGNSQVVSQAADWIQADRSPTEQLIGASWLLNQSNSSDAQVVMEKLSRGKIPHIAMLATAQLWRVAIPNQIAERRAEWSDYRDRMPLPLQLGPTMTIADRLERTGQKDAAVQEWLRVMATFSEHPREVQVARQSSVELLKQLGRNEEARRIEGGVAGP